MRALFLSFLCLFFGCSGMEQSEKERMKKRNERKDRVHRLSSEVRYPPPRIVPQIRDPYPWETGYIGGHPPITQEAFRCKGDPKNPAREERSGPVHDCGGVRSHSLPLREKKEFVYPILLDILNYIRIETSGPVIVTCGHRCPLHQSYADGSVYHMASKHMIGAEVDFYVAGMEEKPLEIVNLIMKYYKETEAYRGRDEYQNFSRLDSVKFDVATTPWYNKEILIKLYRKNEGRDLDNLHPYPYLSIQVRFDRARNEKVTYSRQQAFEGYIQY